MLDLESLDLFAQLLSGFRLEAGDPDLVAKAEVISRVRTNLMKAIEEVKSLSEKVS